MNNLSLRDPDANVAAERQDISALSKESKKEIAGYIKRDNLELVNANAAPVRVKDTFYTRVGKRCIDAAISLVCLLITSPINLVIAVVTYFDVGRPIIFRQQRTGKDEKPFTIYKFRNMTNDTDANGELLPPEKRVTRWGKFVRKTSLDELLNFVSVLKGDMSVIGPRPLPDYYAERLNVRHKAMYAVRPGLECPTIKSVDHPLSWEERLESYVWYVENCSFWVDLRLCFRMVAITFDRKSTTRRSVAGHGGFLGYGPDGSVLYTKSVPSCYVEEFCENHGYADLRQAVDARALAEEARE